MADQQPLRTGSAAEQSEQSPEQPALATPTATAATPVAAACTAAEGGDSALRAAFDSLSLRTPEASRHAADSAAADESRSLPDGAGVISVAAEGSPNVGVHPAGKTDAAEPVPDTQLATSTPPSAEAATPSDVSGNDHQTQAHGAMQPAVEPAPALTPAEDSGRPSADASPEPATPPPSSGVSLVIPSAAVTVVPATPSAPDAEPRIKVQLSRGEAEALAEQLAAVALGAPPTPPTARVPEETLVGLVYDKCMELHVGPESHWERPARTAELFKLVTEQGLAAQCWTLPPRQATDAELRLAHTAEHIAAVEAGYDPEAEPPIGDIYYSAGTAAAARTAAGSTIAAAQWVMEGDVPRSALAVVRPPGHHAECSCAMGFCFYNNVVLAALSLLQQGLERILIFDWDVHHGNGTEHMLEHDPRVMYMSLHRGNGFYPNTGAATDVGTGAGQGFTVNVPWMKGGVGDADYLAAWDLVLGPIARAFAPQAVLVSAGFDAAEGDPLGGCRLTPHGYGRMTQALAALSGGRILLALEGGYNMRATSEAAAACLGVLLGAPPPPPDPFAAPRPLAGTQAAMQAAAQAQAPHWPVLQSVGSREAFAARWAEHVATLTTPRNTRSRTGRNRKEVEFVVCV